MKVDYLQKLDKETLVDIVGQYDKYIQEANDYDKYSQGWFPVCVQEFYEEEYQEITRIKTKKSIKKGLIQLSFYKRIGYEDITSQADKDRVKEKIATEIKGSIRKAACEDYIVEIESIYVGRWGEEKLNVSVTCYTETMTVNELNLFCEYMKVDKSVLQVNSDIRNVDSDSDYETESIDPFGDGEYLIEAKAEKPRCEPTIEKILSVSTANMSKKAAGWLEATFGTDSYITGYKKDEFGWFLCVDEDLEVPKHIPKSIRKLIKYAKKLGVQWIDLDCDGPIDKNLKEYDW